MLSYAWVFKCSRTCRFAYCKWHCRLAVQCVYHRIFACAQALCLFFLLKHKEVYTYLICYKQTIALTYGQLSHYLITFKTNTSFIHRKDAFPTLNLFLFKIPCASTAYISDSNRSTKKLYDVKHSHIKAFQIVRNVEISTHQSPNHLRR